jgi:hypothetical protein
VFFRNRKKSYIDWKEEIDITYPEFAVKRTIINPGGLV